ncbi:MAG: tetratricopeptide repeat protein [Muribaculaceae bacterium]
MKKIIYTLLFFILPLVASSATLTEQADSAYNKDNFNKALSIYLDIAKNEGSSSDLYYNIGNTYYRLGNLGKSILFYERAIALNPNNENAKINLDFVNGKIIDQTLTPESNILTNITDSFMSGQSSNGWAVIAIISFILFLLAGMLYIFSTSILFRKIGFFGGVILVIFVIISNIFAFRMRNKIEDKNSAIITTQSVTLSTSPRIPKDKSEEAFILNEGTKIMILDSVVNTLDKKAERWYDVKADNAHRAWINAKNVEVI